MDSHKVLNIILLQHVGGSTQNPSVIPLKTNINFMMLEDWGAIACAIALFPTIMEVENGPHGG